MIESSSAGQAPLHVLTITPFYPRAGNESFGCFVAEPLAELTKAGVRASVFAVSPFYWPKPGSSESAPDAAWYRYLSLPAGIGLASAGWGLYFRLRGPMAKLRARIPVDIIHAHGALPCGHAARLLSRHFKIPYMVTVHGRDAFSSVQVAGWPGAWCARVSQQVFLGARRVLGISRAVCEEVEKGAGGGCAVSVVYNGADPSLFTPALFTPAAEPVRPSLLTVGNLIPTKGHELIVQALAALQPEFPELTWEVIGDGPELTRLRQLAEKLGVLASIRFRGRQSRREVAEACRRCSLFVLPSRYEGLGCAYLEAMASGKVAVGCRGQGIEEVIRHGENGWLVPAEGRQELVEGLRLLLKDCDLRKKIGAAARDTILQSFTLGHQAERLLAIYQEIKA
jgi:teichuronic acid biosynthesis glycosyltransferase TuaC